MASRLNPYLSFDGNARSALEFYSDVLGGTLTVNTYGEYGDPGAPGSDKVMHGMIVTDSGMTLMGSDNPPDAEHNPGNNIAISLSGENADDLRGYWEKLSDEATVTVPLERQMWGDEFGMLIDKFGIGWMVNIVSPENTG